MAGWLNLSKEGVNAYMRTSAANRIVPIVAVLMPRLGLKGPASNHHTWSDFHTIATERRQATPDSARTRGQPPIVWDSLPLTDAPITPTQRAYATALQLVLEDPRRQDIGTNLTPAEALGYLRLEHEHWLAQHRGTASTD